MRFFEKEIRIRVTALNPQFSYKPLKFNMIIFYYITSYGDGNDENSKRE